MDRKLKSLRMRVDLLDWVKEYAAGRGSTEIAVFEQAVISFKRDTEGGVPDLPAAEVRREEQVSKASVGPTYNEIMLERQRKLNARLYGGAS